MPPIPENHPKYEEVRRILLDPLTWAQTTRSIARFTGCPFTTAWGIRRRLIRSGVIPANPHGKKPKQKPRKRLQRSS
jgi:hypothetical protein